MPRNIINSSSTSGPPPQESYITKDELSYMAEMIMSQNEHLLDGDLDYIKQQIKDQLKEAQTPEKVLLNGNTPAYACGPLTKERYINPKIEQELVEFKQEIEDKFIESHVNKTYKFPRVA